MDGMQAEAQRSLIMQRYCSGPNLQSSGSNFVTSLSIDVKHLSTTLLAPLDVSCM